MFKLLPFLVLLISLGFHLPWLEELSFGKVPGPVDPVLKIIQGYSLYKNNFSNQSLFYRFKDIDKNYEFCTFQNDIFSVKIGDQLLGPFPVALSGFIAIALQFISVEKLFYVFVILNFLLYLLIYQLSPKSIPLSILIFFGLPFFIPNSEVSEHAILLILQVSSIGIFIKASIQKKLNHNVGNFIFFISGILLGSGLFLRHEVLIFGNLFLLTISLLKYFLNKRKVFWSFNNILFFAIGMYFVFILFFLMNDYFYNTFLGPRLTANKTGIFSGIWEKLRYYVVLLWKSPPQHGFFGYNPAYFLTFILLFVNRKRISGIDLALLLPSLGLFLIVPVLAPNDGGAPWGPRYLFLAVYPMVFLTGRCLIWNGLVKNKKQKYLTVALFILATIHSVSNERKGIRSAIEVAKLQSEYIKQTTVKDVDLIIFTNELVAMQTGLNYIYYPTILVSDENKMNSFREKFLSQDMVQTIALIEPKTSHLNLDHFTEMEKKGMKPVELIKQFDILLEKKSVIDLELVKIHKYQKKTKPSK